MRFYLPLSHLRKQRGMSERALAEAAAVSRGLVRQITCSENFNVTMKSIRHLATFFERDVDVILTAKEIFPEFSTVAIGYKMERDGFGSWKTHLFDFVDEFRRAADSRLIILPPPSSLEPRLIALIASSTRALCEELEITPPAWATRRLFLPTPWFVSEMNSLKASAIVESPLVYRANNIFVHENFLARA